jgi:hypothetical protein
MAENHYNCTCSYCGARIHRAESKITDRVFCDRDCFAAHTRKKADLTGKRFGNLNVVEYLGIRNHRQCWKCICDCGNFAELSTNEIRTGNTKSCGCRIGILKHGLADSPEYKVWIAMKMRCLNKKDAAYLDYGGRGITVCDAWRDSFEAFINDMGRRPSSSLMLERIDNEKGYEKGNCKWATPLEQGRNRRSNHLVTFNGESLAIAEWADRLHISQQALGFRLKHWPIEDALTKPRGKRGYRHTPTFLLAQRNFQS